MEKIKESRYITIENIVINLSNVKLLVDEVYKEYSKIMDKSYRKSIEYSVKCDDNSTFESEDISLFSDDSIINKKRVISIDISFYFYNIDNDFRNSIRINLNHGNTTFGNDITVSGTDSKWVNGMIKRLEENVDSFKPQSTFFKNHKFISTSILALGLGIVYVWIIIFFINATSSPSANETTETLSPLKELFINYPIIKTMILYLLGLIAGIIPASLIIEKLNSLWPSVEIQIGPEHTFIEKKRRFWLISFLLFGVLPIVVGFVVELIKYIL